MAARDDASSTANGGLRSAAATRAELAPGAESQSSSGIDVGRSSAPSALASEASSAITKLSPESCVVGKREATATRRACTTWPPKESSSLPLAPALAATSGLATTGRRRPSNGWRGRSSACWEVSIT